MTQLRCDVLLVEDDPDIREALSQILADEGYEVALAGNGREALDMLRSPVLPSLVLLDLMMPVMNGWQFRMAQCADPLLAAIPVVVISADGSAQREAMALGAEAFLQKPLALNELLTAVARFCPRTFAGAAG